MAATVLYDGQISGATMITKIGSSTAVLAVPYSNGQRVVLINLAA